MGILESFLQFGAQASQTIQRIDPVGAFQGAQTAALDNVHRRALTEQVNLGNEAAAMELEEMAATQEHRLMAQNATAMAQTVTALEEVGDFSGALQTMIEYGQQDPKSTVELREVEGEQIVGYYDPVNENWTPARAVDEEYAREWKKIRFREEQDSKRARIQADAQFRRAQEASDKAIDNFNRMAGKQTAKAGMDQALRAMRDAEKRLEDMKKARGAPSEDLTATTLAAVKVAGLPAAVTGDSTFIQTFASEMPEDEQRRLAQALAAEAELISREIGGNTALIRDSLLNNIITYSSDQMNAGSAPIRWVKGKFGNGWYQVDPVALEEYILKQRPLESFSGEVARQRHMADMYARIMKDVEGFEADKARLLADPDLEGLISPATPDWEFMELIIEGS